MKKTRFYILLAVFLLASTPIFALGGAAKSLAKQVQNLSKKAVALEEKAAGIEEKALALSDRDRRAYQAELERLGFVPPPGLFSDGEALLTGAPEAPESAGGIAGLIGGLFGGSRSSGGNATAPPDETATAPPASTTAPATPAPSTTPAPTSSGSGGTFTLTGIPSQYNGKYAMSSGGNTAGTINVFGAQTMSVLEQEQAISAALVPIRNGRAVLNLYVPVAGQAGQVGQLNRYTASDTIGIGVIISDQASAGNVLDLEFNTEVIVWFENVSFRNGSATMAWSAGTVEEGVSSSATPGTFTLTGIPSQYNGKYAMFQSREAAIIGAQAIDNVEGEFTGTLVPIRSGRAAMNLWRVTPAGFAPYKGSDTVKATVMIYNQATVTDSDSPTEDANVEFASVSFRNGDAAQAWSAGTVTEFTHTYRSAWSFNETQHWHDCTDNDGAKSGVSSHTGGAACTVCGHLKWTAVADSTFGGTSISAVTWGGNRFVAGGDRGKMAYSADGATWTAVADSTFGSDQFNTINAIAWGNDTFVAGGQGAGGGNAGASRAQGGRTGRIAYSADGISWTAAFTSSTFSLFGNSAAVVSIAFGTASNAGGRLVAVGRDINRMAYSVDGVSWTAVANTGFSLSVHDIAYGTAGNAGGRFVAVGGQGKMAYSADGVSWTAVDMSGIFGSGRYENINAVTWGGNRFVAVGTDGKMAYSADGVTWTAVADSGFGTYEIYDIAYGRNTAGNGKFVAVGQYGRMAYSADGATWTGGTDIAFSGRSMSSIVYASGRFVAVGGEGRIMYADW